MAQLLEPGQQKIVGAKKVLSHDGDKYVYEISVNGALQKDTYERMLAAKMKDTEIKGFRKGEAPRNAVEPQLYPDLAKELVNLMVNYSVEELLSDEGIIATMAPEVDKVDFAMVETPIKFTVKIERLPDYKLPDTKKFKVTMTETKVDAEEVIKAKENLFAEWLKKAKDEDKTEFTEMSDLWVEKQMGIPDVKTIAALEELLQHELAHAKLHQEEDKLVGGALDKAIESMKIVVPASVVARNVESNKKQQEEQMKQYGITFEDYLKHYKKTEAEYNKEVEDAAEKRFREDVFWTLFIKDRGVKVDPKDPKDIVFINYAASMLRVKSDDKLSQRQVDVILQTAAMYKALQVFKEEIGLKMHEEPEVEVGGHSHA
jgi:FKBP-type peptidyl-prolyl cis-trans isomerase (trigger factor)